MNAPRAKTRNPDKPTKPVASSTIAALRRRLLRWYDVAHRRLPWRAEPPDRPNPYHVLVSEAMLQQTQAATVVPYFGRFVTAFPDVNALSAAPEQQVLRLWQGLGYYRRARHLHAAARKVVAVHGGQLPTTADELRALPGIGRYTAGAIASLAFGQPSPIVDGNVARVLSRWFALTETIDSPAGTKRLWELAEKLVPPSRPGDFNQGLMELGAMICTPRKARCGECPVSSLCLAKKQSLQDRLPVRSPRRAPASVRHHILALHRRGMFLFEQRPEKGLWSRMWQLPTAERIRGRGTPARLAQWAEEHFELTIKPPWRLGTFTHQTSHRTIHFVLWKADVQSLHTGDGPPGAVWRGPGNIDDLPLPNPQQMALRQLIAARQ
jgi:A/G-specific adenine glycosylase